MKKLTNLLLAGREKERRKKAIEKCSNRWSKSAVEWQNINGSNRLINVAVLGVHSPVMRSRHQEN